MKHLITFAAVVLSMTLFLSAGCSNDSASQKSDQEQTQKLSEKGKMDMSGEIPPAPGDEEAIEKQEQKDEPVQKQTQKQSQKS